MGGIFQFEFVNKPKHYDFTGFNMTWHERNGELLVRKNAAVDMDKLRKSYGNPKTMAEIVQARKSRLSRRLTHMSVGESAALVVDMDNLGESDPAICPLFIVTFQLPSSLCLWSDPIVCQFEDNVVGYEDHNLTPQLPASTSKLDIQAPQIPLSSQSVYSMQWTSPVEARSTFKLQLGDKARFSMASNVFKNRYSTTKLAVPEEEPIFFNDFDLNKKLTKEEIRHLEIYCIPRILSSFKFPIEIEEEKNEELRNKPKGMGGTLIRKQGQEEDITSNRIFSYDDQNNPERLYPIFPKPPYIPYDTQPTENDPENFFELLAKLDEIKKKYRKKVLNFYEMPAFATTLNLKTMWRKSIRGKHETEGSLTDLSLRLSLKSTKKSKRRIKRTAHSSVVSKKTSHGSLRSSRQSYISSRTSTISSISKTRTSKQSNKSRQSKASHKIRSSKKMSVHRQSRSRSISSSKVSKASIKSATPSVNQRKSKTSTKSRKSKERQSKSKDMERKSKQAKDKERKSKDIKEKERKSKEAKGKEKKSKEAKTNEKKPKEAEAKGKKSKDEKKEKSVAKPTSDMSISEEKEIASKSPEEETKSIKNITSASSIKSNESLKSAKSTKITKSAQGERKSEEKSERKSSKISKSELDVTSKPEVEAESKTDEQLTTNATAAETDDKSLVREEGGKEKRGKSEIEEVMSFHSVAESDIESIHSHKRDKKKSKKLSLNVEETKEETKPKQKMVYYSHWTNKYIYHSEFNRETSTMKVWTDRLGKFESIKGM